MEFRVLGSIEAVEEGNGSIALGGPKQRAVLAHLLLRANHLVPTDVLIDEVWGEEPPETARNALQSYTSHLRKALGPERIEGSRAGYRLRAEASELDAARFQSLLRDARRLLPIDAQAAVGAFDRALALWRGPAFADLAAEPSLRAEAARLDELRLGALEDRVGAQLTIGQHAEVVGELETLTARYPLRERLWEQLMLALYRSGRQAESLAAYDRARGLLADELGIDPSPELRKLHERVLAQSPELDASGEPLRGYRLLERLGEDPFGVVYRATQPNVGREVAIRVVHEHRANDPAFIRRFDADAQAVAMLEHPYVASVYDYWREPGRAYVVTRFLRGGSLRDFLDQPGSLQPERSRRILEQVGSALAAAHRRGVGHGDVRVSNVLLDEEGNAYLTDFSIGRGTVGAADDLEAFAALARELLHERVPMAVGHALHRAETATAPDEVFALFAEIVTALGTGSDVPAPTSVDARNPYKGLRPFLEPDADDFFGREAFIERLLARLSHPDHTGRFVAVVGPSGSGKSSVISAGLVAAIRRGAIPGSERWFVTELHPGHHPFEELGAALMRVAVNPPAGLLTRLESGPRGLLEVVSAIVPRDAELLLVVDQFEELFTLTESEDDRALLLESLRVATADPSSRMRVIATLRADFYDRPLRYPRMGPLLGSTTEVLSPLTPEELERAIVRPAERSGLSVDSALVPQIAADVAEQPGALPLVQYALTELYDRRLDGRLTLQAYGEIGGVGGALAASAEHLYATRRDAGREAVRQLFLRLVTLGEGTADTRRRVPLSELSAIEVDASAMDAAIDTYGRHRLLTFDRDPATREPTVEVAHEALLGAWERLSGWIDEARDDVRKHRRLSDAAAEWERSGHDPSYLLAGSRLDQFGSWGSSTSLALGLEERAFLAASVARRDEERAKEVARRDRERSLERRSVKRLRALVAALTTAIIVAATLTAIAVNRNAEAQRASRLATTRELVSAAVANLAVDRELAILLALEAIRTHGDDDAILPEAEETLRRAAPAVSIDTTSIIGSRIDSYDFTPSGRDVAMVGADGSVGVWDLVTGARRLAFPSTTLTTEHACSSGTACASAFATPGPSIDLSDNATLLAAVDWEGRARVWDIDSGREVLSVRSGDDGLIPGLPLMVALSPDGRLLATSAFEGMVRTIRVWDMTGQEVWSQSLLTSWGDLLDFSPDGTRLFFEFPFDRGPVNVWDVTTGGTITLPKNRFWRAVSASGSRFTWTGRPGKTFVFNPEGDTLATNEGNGRRERVRLVRRNSSRLLEGHTTEPIRVIAFSEDGTRLATGGFDGAVRVWNAASGDLIFTSPVEPSDLVGVAFSPDGSRITGIYSDGRIIAHAIALEDVIEIARARVTRGFTADECRRYLHVPSCPAD